MLLWGDIIHVAAVQFPLPATTISFDSDMDAAAQTRHKVLEDAASHGYLVAGSHISFPGIGRVKALKPMTASRTAIAGCRLTTAWPG